MSSQPGSSIIAQLAAQIHRDKPVVFVRYICKFTGDISIIVYSLFVTISRYRNAAVYYNYSREIVRRVNENASKTHQMIEVEKRKRNLQYN